MKIMFLPDSVRLTYAKSTILCNLLKVASWFTIFFVVAQTNRAVVFRLRNIHIFNDAALENRKLWYGKTISSGN